MGARSQRANELGGHGQSYDKWALARALEVAKAKKILPFSSGFWPENPSTYSKTDSFWSMYRQLCRICRLCAVELLKYFRSLVLALYKAANLELFFPEEAEVRGLSFIAAAMRMASSLLARKPLHLDFSDHQSYPVE